MPNTRNSVNQGFFNWKLIIYTVKFHKDLFFRLHTHSNYQRCNTEIWVKSNLDRHLGHCYMTDAWTIEMNTFPDKQMNRQLQAAINSSLSLIDKLTRSFSLTTIYLK